MPLSVTTMTSSGICLSSSIVVSSDVSKVRRLRLLIPIMGKSSGKARCSSSASCTSTKTSISNLIARSLSSLSCSSVKQATMSKIQSAPIPRASYTWYGSIMNSLRSTGREQFSRACFK